MATRHCWNLLACAVAALLLASGARSQDNYQRQAEAVLRTWQPRLKLGNWQVTVTLTNATALKPKTIGDITIDAEHRQAVIRVLDPADTRLAPDKGAALVEGVVVHELVHLGLTPVLNEARLGDRERQEEERFVQHVTDALLGR